MKRLKKEDRIKKWLREHGDRDMSDVLMDEDGMYVLMRDKRQDVKVYIPIK